MWKSGIYPRGATYFFPQGLCEISTAFHRGCEKKFLHRFFNRLNFHIPQDLWKTLKTIICTFLVPTRKVPKEPAQGALRANRAPLRIPRRIAGTADRKPLLFLSSSQRGKNRNIFAPPGFQVKFLRTSQVRPGWVHREGRILRAGARHTAPSL